MIVLPFIPFSAHKIGSTYEKYLTFSSSVFSFYYPIKPQKIVTINKYLIDWEWISNYDMSSTYPILYLILSDYDN